MRSLYLRCREKKNFFGRITKVYGLNPAGYRNQMSYVEQKLEPQSHLHRDAISRLLEGIANGKKLSKDHALVVRPRYVEVKELSTGRQLTKTYLQDIAYCAADANRPNVFLYICKHQGQQLQCRVFWCSRAERARDMTACLAHSFQRALSDWQQNGSATLQPGEVRGKRGEDSSNSPANMKSSTLPASLGKVRWKKSTSVSRSPLRGISRRGSASDKWN